MSATKWLVLLMVVLLSAVSCRSAESQIIAYVEQTLAAEKTFQADVAIYLQETEQSQAHADQTLAAQPTNTPVPSVTPEPSATPEPVNTPTPENTRRATYTPKPSATVGLIGFQYPDNNYCPDGFPLLIWDLGSYYSFEVNTVNNAEGFVWTFYQNKKIVYDTWRESGGLLIEGTRYDTNYGDISKKFQEGLLTIQVRSKLRNGSWTEPSYLFVYLKPATQNNPSFNCPVPYPLPTPIVPDNQCGTGFTRLKIGDQARVAEEVGIGSLTVRQEPSASAAALGSYKRAQNETVSIINGPICASGNIYWQVEGSFIPGALGWVGEGDFQDYWLEPVK